MPEAVLDSLDDMYTCPVCHTALYAQTKGTEKSLLCPSCAGTYHVHDGVPILLPGIAYKKYSLQRVKAIYEKAYQIPSVMGTKVDPEYSQATKSRLLSMCVNAPGMRVLDVGTGDGDLWQLAPRDWQWYGIDISETAIRDAMQRFPCLRAAAAMAEYLPYAAGYFGAVVAADTLEHAFDLNRSLAEIRRVLVPGGRFALSLPMPHSLMTWGQNTFLSGRWSLRTTARLIHALVRRTLMFGRPTFQIVDRDMSVAEWRSLIEEAGFEIMIIEEWPVSPLKPMVYLIAARTHP